MQITAPFENFIKADWPMEMYEITETQITVEPFERNLLNKNSVCSVSSRENPEMPTQKEKSVR